MKELRGRAGDAMPAEEGPSLEERRAAALSLLREHVQAGDAIAAKTVHEDAVKEDGPWDLPGPDLLGLAKLLHKSGLWQEALPLLEEYVERFPRQSAAPRLLLAKLLIEEARRPASGLDVLDSIPAGTLTSAQEDLRQRLAAKANELRQQGVLELDVE